MRVLLMRALISSSLTPEKQARSAEINVSPNSRASAVRPELANAVADGDRPDADPTHLSQ